MPRRPDVILDHAERIAAIAMAFGDVLRATRLPDGVRAEPDTTHTVMLIWLACELCPPELDRGKVAMLASVHDLPEVRSSLGDVNSFGITADARHAKEEAERAARIQLRNELGNNWMMRTLDEYEEQLAPEARYVRLFDKIVPKLTHALNACAALRALGHSAEHVEEVHRIQLAKLSAEYPEFPSTLALLAAAMDRSVESYPLPSKV